MQMIGRYDRQNLGEQNSKRMADIGVSVGKTVRVITQADHKLNMRLKTVLMKDRRAKLKAGRGEHSSSEWENYLTSSENILWKRNCS